MKLIKKIFFSLILSILVIENISGIVMWANGGKTGATEWIENATLTLSWDRWIKMDTWCLLDWTCQYSIYESLWIKKVYSWEETSVMTYVSDVVYWATSFIGTVITVALIYSWFKFILAGADSSQKSKAMLWIKYSLIGLVLVTLSYVIIRAIQYLAGWRS